MAKLFAFEGVDKVGKSTIIQVALRDPRLASYSIKHLRFPDRTTPIGQEIDRLLHMSDLDDKLLLQALYALNRHEVLSTVNLPDYDLLLVERWRLSFLAYGCGYEKLPSSLVAALWNSLPIPTRYFLLLMSEAAFDARATGDQYYETPDKARKLQELYLLYCPRIVEAPVTVVVNETLQATVNSVVTTIVKEMHR